MSSKVKSRPKPKAKKSVARNVARKAKPKEESNVVVVDSNDVAKEFGVKLPEQSEDKFLSPNDIGKILNVTGEAVKQWIYHRRLPAVKLSNGYWKIKASDLSAFLKARSEYGRRRVLLIMGQPAKYEAAIKDLGHDVMVALNAADAMLKAADAVPSLTIIEVGGSLDGLKLAEQFRNMKQLRSSSILLVSESAMTEAEIARALDIKAVGSLASGEVAGLQAEVKRILGGP